MAEERELWPGAGIYLDFAHIENKDLDNIDRRLDQLSGTKAKIEFLFELLLAYQKFRSEVGNSSDAILEAFEGRCEQLLSNLVEKLDLEIESRTADKQDSGLSNNHESQSQATRRTTKERIETAVSLPLFRLTFSWQITVEAKKLITDRGEDRIEISQVISINDEGDKMEEGSRGEMTGGPIDESAMSMRVGYVKKHLADHLSAAVEALNREANALTDFLLNESFNNDQSVLGEAPIGKAFQDRAKAGRVWIRTEIEEVCDEQKALANNRIDGFLKDYLKDRYRHLLKICEQIKNQHDVLKAKFESSQNNRNRSLKEWEKVWSEHSAPRLKLPTYVWIEFAKGKNAQSIARSILGLETGYEESTIENYLKPSKRLKKEKSKEFKLPKIVGLPSHAGKKESKRKK